MEKIREALLPLMIVLAALCPVIVTGPVIDIWPSDSVIVSAIPSVKFVPPLPEPLPKVIVSAPTFAFASRIASRSVVKLSAVVLSAPEVTTNAARRTRCSSSVSDARDGIESRRRKLRERREEWRC